MRALLLFLFLFPLLAAPPDSAIERSLRARLARSKMAKDGLSFTVRQGVVEWHGSVSIPQRKGAATRMAKAAGASKVVNRIRIPAPASPVPAAPRQVHVQMPPR